QRLGNKVRRRRGEDHESAVAADGRMVGIRVRSDALRIDTETFCNSPLHVADKDFPRTEARERSIPRKQSDAHEPAIVADRYFGDSSVPGVGSGGKDAGEYRRMQLPVSQEHVRLVVRIARD